MKVLLFGATGMLGQAALRECLLAPDVEAVLTVGRTATGRQAPKLRELVRPDLFDLGPVEGELRGYDACFFCLGVSAAGMTEEAYRHLTYDLTLSIAGLLARQNPTMAFLYVSGAGTDSTEQGRSMWARVKGRTENALLRLPFRAVYLFRPGYIQPMHGITSRTPLYRALYVVIAPLFPLFRGFAANQVSTSEQVGRAMLEVVRQHGPSRVLEIRDINALAPLAP
jgi:uncharacterized protein YbjT (DUF2867 family)